MHLVVYLADSLIKKSNLSINACQFCRDCAIPLIQSFGWVVESFDWSLPLSCWLCNCFDLKTRTICQNMKTRRISIEAGTIQLPRSRAHNSLVQRCKHAIQTFHYSVSTFVGVWVPIEHVKQRSTGKDCFQLAHKWLPNEMKCCTIMTPAYVLWFRTRLVELIMYETLMMLLV